MRYLIMSGKCRDMSRHLIYFFQANVIFRCRDIYGNPKCHLFDARHTCLQAPLVATLHEAALVCDDGLQHSTRRAVLRLQFRCLPVPAPQVKECPCVHRRYRAAAAIRQVRHATLRKEDGVLARRLVVRPNEERVDCVEAAALLLLDRQQLQVARTRRINQIT